VTWSSYCSHLKAFPAFRRAAQSCGCVARVAAHEADVSLGFDGGGDRCGVVDNTGAEIFADKVGVMLARDMSAIHKNADVVVDVKSTGRS
jgi:phosphomannomutase